MPVGTAAVVITKGPELMASVKPEEEAVFPRVSVTCAVMGKVPLRPVGVPEIMPVPLSVKPAGNGPEVRLQEYGGTPPVAANEFE